jgi:hypothetical protein
MSLAYRVTHSQLCIFARRRRTAAFFAAALAWLTPMPLARPQAGLEQLEQPLNFSREILPVLTQAGCNSGACHGAAAGRGYLTLSLFGTRPSDDYRALVFDLPGRYVDVENPLTSKLLQKPMGDLDHGGGLRLDESSEGYRLLRQWISQGAPRGIEDRLLDMEVLPNRRLLVHVNQTAHIRVQSRWESGEIRDATGWIAIADAESLAVPDSPVHVHIQNGTLQLTPNRPGYWPISLRIADHSLTLQVLVPGESLAEPVQAAIPSRPGLPKQDLAVESGIARRINRHARDVQQQLKLPACDPCSDTLLVRRWWVDLLGRPPTLDEWDTAVSDLKRGGAEKIVDDLLKSDEFADRLAAEMVTWGETSSQAHQATPELREELASNLLVSDRLLPLVRRMLLVSSADSRDAVDVRLNKFHLLANDPRSRLELITQCWMGIRLECARCHDHPLDRWTQVDYYGLAACWSEIEVRDGIVLRVPGAKTTDLLSGRDATPRLPDGMTGRSTLEADDAASVGRPDVEFIDWLLDQENHLFHGNVVNRIWSWLCGDGLFQPVDDQRVSNPALHSALLEELVAEFKLSGCSLKSLIRGIVLSEPYAQRSSEAATALEYATFSTRRPKRIPDSPERLATRIFQSNVPSDEQEQPRVDAMMVANGNGCRRGGACRDPIGESIELVTGDSLNDFVRRTIEVRREGSPSAVELMRDLHRHLFRELPSEAEEQRWPSCLGLSGFGESAEEERNTLEAAEDLLWSWLVGDRFRKLY